MQNNLDRSKRITKNTLFLFFRMALVLCVNLWTSRVVLDILGIEDYGIYNVVGGVVIFFSFFQNALTNATYRFFAYDVGKNNLADLKHTFSMALNIHLILSLVIFVLCETVGLYIINRVLNIDESRMFAANIAYHFSVLCFCLSIFRTPYNSAIIAHEEMSFFALTGIIEVLLKLAIVYMLLLFDIDKLTLYSFLVFSVTLSISIWYYLFCKRRFSECHYEKYWDGDQCKKMLQYSGWSLVVNGADVSVSQSIVFFVNIFFGVAANAALGLANQIGTQLNQFLSSFTQAYNPQIIKSYASGDRDYFIKLIFTSSKVSYFLLLLVSVPLILNIDFILVLWLKNPPKETSSFIKFVIAYSLVDAYSAPLWTGVHATGNLKTHQILMSSIKILNIPLAYIMLKMGLQAWTILALKAGLNIVCSIVRPCYVKKLYGLPLKNYMIHVFGVVYLTTIIVLPLPTYLATTISSSWARLITTSLAYFLIFFPTVFFIGLTPIERNFVKSLITKRFSQK